ncbi:MAG: CoA pyrophosphatase [Bacteroidota bacterium]|nr:CoA pyrophosphatase [Bacteroidota bacterium]
MFSSFINKLKSELEKELPGVFAQEKMSPSNRSNGYVFPENKMEAQQSSVLILLYPKGSGINTVLIERNKYNGAHSGQISLPGGKYEKSDKDLIETAIREAGEEIGIDRKKVKVIGKLSSLYVPVSNFQILPVIGYLNNIPSFTPDPKEVNHLIDVKINDLFDPLNTKTEELIRHNYRVTAPYFELGRHHVWGATAMILSELREIMRNAKLISA